MVCVCVCVCVIQSVEQRTTVVDSDGNEKVLEKCVNINSFLG